jgi:hypothetical protein
MRFKSVDKNLKINIYRNIILPVVLYGCETWSLTLREERKLRVFENMVLRRIFGPRTWSLTLREERKLRVFENMVLRNTELSHSSEENFQTQGQT